VLLNCFEWANSILTDIWKFYRNIRTIPKIVVLLLLFFTNIHFVELPPYEHDLLQPSDDFRFFYATPEYAGGSRIRYTSGWSFHCVTKKVYRKKRSMKLDSTIGTLKFE
jgi:hypothetical protein